MTSNGESQDNTSKVQELLKKHSKGNIDEYIQASTFQSEKVHNAIRDHIALEYKTWFFFRKLGSDAGRSNIALHGFSQLFKRSATECFNDAMFLENYLVQRGGFSKPADIPAPSIIFPDSPVDIIYPVYEALQAEKTLLEDCLKLAHIADEHMDSALEDLIEDRFLKKETKHVKDFGDLLQQAVRVSKDIGHGVYQLDKELRATKGIVPWGNANHPDFVDELLADAMA